MVVLFPGVERAWRESFIMDGFPVEAFVHDGATLGRFFERDVEHGRPVMISLAAEGRLVGSRVEEAAGLRARAQFLLDAGPAPLAGERLELMLYQISDLADDLRGRRDRGEVMAIAVALYPKLVDLILLGQRRWTGAGKWLQRRLVQADPDLASQMESAMAEAVGGDGGALLALCCAELDRHGGPVFADFRRLSDVEGRGGAAMKGCPV
ncbi:nucleotidyltransferase domain-containing protein [Devosia sp.]|uniref:nucleotidyltransferase domain-containing protein n=1 Tax=Devosia sp. TaxID=1871048 RepID=UPI002622EECA|nr:nucleotidyltransferase domain-containing protein [Devosia sp.]